MAQMWLHPYLVPGTQYFLDGGAQAAASVWMLRLTGFSMYRQGKVTGTFSHLTELGAPAKRHTAKNSSQIINPEKFGSKDVSSFRRDFDVI